MPAALLPLGIRRTLFRSFVKAAFKRGLSGNQMIRIARGLGISYRTKLMREDIREVTGLIKKAKAWRFIPKKYFPPRWLMEETDFAIKTNYHYCFEVTLRDKVTGLIETVNRTIATDDFLTIRQAEEQLIEYVIDPIKIFYEDEKEVIKWELPKVRKKKSS